MGKIKTDAVQGLFASHMPFAVYELGTEKPQLYPTAHEAYYDVLMRLYMEFPKGYIDMALFVNEHQGVPIRDAERYCVNGEYFKINLTNIQDGARMSQLRAIFCILLKKTGCDFDESTFRTALFNFDNYLIKTTVNNAVGKDGRYKFKTEDNGDKEDDAV